MLSLTNCDQKPIDQKPIDTKPIDVGLEKIKSLGMKMILIEGGNFVMGKNDNSEEFFKHPEHKVDVEDFYMSKTEITVGQYNRCVYAGVCSPPNWDNCYIHFCSDSEKKEKFLPCKEFGVVDSDFKELDKPVVCVDWHQARTFANWIGGDLPSEAQWEYASRSKGKRTSYPWGNHSSWKDEHLTCSYAIVSGMYDYDTADSGDGCGKRSTWDVCSKVDGNTEQGLCDTVGNAEEWILDEWFNSYEGAYSDDIPKCSNKNCLEPISEYRAVRGGSWDNIANPVHKRSLASPNQASIKRGFRVAKTLSLNDLEKRNKKIEERVALMANQKKMKDDVFQSLTLIKIKGGSFMMGGKSSDDEKPIHAVTVKDFSMTKTEVTVKQYRKCVDAGACSAPHWDDNTCYVYNGSRWEKGILGEKFREDQKPVVCVDWQQAREFAKWVDGDLPSEAQWEYASRSRGRNVKYPWGNKEANCDVAVMDDGGYGCGRYETWEVCSKTGGNTAQGLCDMGGNVMEWVLDEWHGSYENAPSKDIGWCSDRRCDSNTSASRVYRGGSLINDASFLRSADRLNSSPDFRNAFLGFRVSFP